MRVGKSGLIPHKTRKRCWGQRLAEDATKAFKPSFGSHVKQSLDVESASTAGIKPRRTKFLTGQLCFSVGTRTAVSTGAHAGPETGGTTGSVAVFPVAVGTCTATATCAV